MKSAKPTLLLHPLFLLSLALLFLNDFFWKAAYGNFVTGKLSDVTGLLVFALTFTEMFPRRKNGVFLATAIGFIWWKTDWSQPFIDWCRLEGRIAWTRVVDHTDLFALLVLLPAYRIRPVMPVAFRWRQPALLLASLFVILADQPPRYLADDGSIYAYRSFTVTKPRDQLLLELQGKGIGFAEDTGTIYQLDRSDLVMMRSDSGGVEWIPLANRTDIEIYRRRNSFTPTYLIPQIVLGKDTLYRLRLTLDEKKEKGKTSVHLLSFYVRPMPVFDYRAQRRMRKQYAKPLKQHLRRLMGG